MESKIEPIPKTMEKFFGCSGTMVKPSPDAVKDIVKSIALGKVITLDQLREKLANEFAVQTACPASTTKALQVLSNEEKPICYWRVIKKKGELISKFPDGCNGHAALLQKEGFEVDFSKKTPRVISYENKLVTLI